MAAAGVTQFLVALVLCLLVVEYRVPWSTAQIGMVGHRFGGVLVARTRFAAMIEGMAIRIVRAVSRAGTSAIAFAFARSHRVIPLVSR